MHRLLNNSSPGRAVRASIPYVIAALMLLLLIPSVGQAGGQNCKLHGSWLGYDQSGSAWWMTTASGMNATQGTLILEAPFFDPTVYGIFPAAVDGTHLRGAWKKTVGRSYDWSVVGYGYDEFRATQYISKLSGKDTMQDCDTMLVWNVTLEVFAPNANPHEDAPLFAFAFPDHYGHRIKVDLP